MAVSGVPESSLQRFRRTFGNMLRKAGVDRQVRRAIAGWHTETAREIDAEERAKPSQAPVRLVMNGRKR